MIPWSRCPPWQRDRPGPNRRSKWLRRRSYTTRWDTIHFEPSRAPIVSIRDRVQWPEHSPAVSGHPRVADAALTCRPRPISGFLVPLHIRTQSSCADRGTMASHRPCGFRKARWQLARALKDQDWVKSVRTSFGEAQIQSGLSGRRRPLAARDPIQAIPRSPPERLLVPKPAVHMPASRSRPQHEAAARQ